VSEDERVELGPARVRALGGRRRRGDATFVWEIREGRLVYMALFFDHEKAVALAHERGAAD
jgi:hypothetical protein